MADKTVSVFDGPSVLMCCHDDGSDTYSLVVSLSADTIADLAAAIVAAMAPE
jgi:hypothetical protein